MWLAASGMVDMFSLPFSHTGHFNFDPPPVLAVAVATLAFPFLMSLVATSSSTLAGRRFGMVSAVGGAFIATNMLTSIVPNNALVPTIPFYAANIIPFIAADLLLSFSRSRISSYAAGAIIGIAFFTLYYPLITYTYEQVLEQTRPWPSEIALTYFQKIGTVLPLVIVPAAALGILGAVASNALILKSKVL